MALFQRRKANESWLQRMSGQRIGAHEMGYRPSVSVSDSLQEVLAGNHLTGGGAYVWQWAVRTCVEFLAKNIAHTNLKAYRRAEDAPEPLERSHPLVRLIQRPNPQTTRFDLIRGTVGDLAIYDEAFWLKRFTRTEKRLYRLPAGMVEAKDSSVLTGPDHYEVDTGNGPVDFSPEEIVHFHGYNPNDPHGGQSPLKSLRPLLTEEREASRYMARLLGKGMRFGGFLSRPATQEAMSDQAIDRFTEGLRRFARGGDREGEWFLLEEGIEPKQSSFSPKDAELMVLREFVLDITATAYHIPLAMLSRTKTPTYASMAEFHKMLYTDVLGPWNAMIEGAVWLQLLPDFGDPDDLFVEFNIDEKLQGDFEAQAAAARQSVQVPWMSVNEMRIKRGLAPIGDSDDPDNPYNKPALPTAYVLIGDGGAQTPTLEVAEAALNGHLDFDADALERILEDR